MDVGRRCQGYTFLWWMNPGGIARILLQHLRLDMTRGWVGVPLTENVKWLSHESLINTSSTKDLHWKYLWCKTTDFHMCMSMCMCVYMRNSRPRTLRFRCLDVKSRWHYEGMKTKHTREISGCQTQDMKPQHNLQEHAGLQLTGLQPAFSYKSKTTTGFITTSSTTSHGFTLHKIPLPDVLNANGTYRVPQNSELELFLFFFSPQGNVTF